MTAWTISGIDQTLTHLLITPKQVATRRILSEMAGKGVSCLVKLLQGHARFTVRIKQVSLSHRGAVKAILDTLGLQLGTPAPHLVPHQRGNHKLLLGNNGD